MSTDNDWERLGRLDPFWAVLSHDAYRRDELSEDRLKAFLATGDEYVDALWRTCRQIFGPRFAPRRILDYGCGVGRVTLPLSRHAEAVIGVDVAESMLSVARGLAETSRASNISYVHAGTSLETLGPFDLVHCFLVLQHVDVRRGLRVIERLANLARPDGMLAVHVLYHNPFRRSALVAAASRIVRTIRRRPPAIQMNAYPLDRVFQILHEAGVSQTTIELTNHGGHLGAMIFCRVQRSEAPETL